MDKNTMLEEVIWSMSNDDFVELWNNFIDCNDERHIYYMEELDLFFSGLSPSEIISRIENNGFSTYDDYFKEDIYSCGFYSFSDPFSEVDFEELIDYIIDNDDDFGVYDIRELLESEEYSLAS